MGDETIGSALRADLSSALLEHGELVLMAKDGTEPVRVHSDLNRGRLRTAFERSGVRWLDKDPHETEFRRWIDGAPELDAYAHGILRSREKALESGQHQAARELREEASSQSLVVRDREGHQQWRRAATT